MLKDVSAFDVSILRHAEDVNYLLHLIRLVQKLDVAPEYPGPDLFCFVYLTDALHLFKNTHA